MCGARPSGPDAAPQAEQESTVSLTLYDLKNAHGEPTSPYSMRSTAALKLLGLAYEHRLLHLGEIAGHFAGEFRTVPVLRDGDRMICDSRTIAEYLAKVHDPEQRLYGEGARPYLTNFVVDWVDATLMGQINRMLVLEIWQQLRPEDQEYYRQLEERQLGIGLELAHAEREARLPAFQISLHPARRAIKSRRFLGGNEPSYADIVLHAALTWGRTISDLPLLREDDRIHEWYGRVEAILAGR